MRTKMEAVVRRCGRFKLMQTEKGFCWSLWTRGGQGWYWHPTTRQWLYNYRGNATEEEASAGLEPTLRHERAGDLDHWHGPPPAHR